MTGATTAIVPTYLPNSQFRNIGLRAVMVSMQCLMLPEVSNYSSHQTLYHPRCHQEALALVPPSITE